MVKILLVLLLMTFLFLGGVLTGISQTGNGTEQRKESLAEPTAEAPIDRETVPVIQQSKQDVPSYDPKESKNRQPDAQAVHLTQKIAAGLETVITGFCNLLIQSVYQLVKVFFL